MSHRDTTSFNKFILVAVSCELAIVVITVVDEYLDYPPLFWGGLSFIMLFFAAYTCVFLSRLFRKDSP